MSDTDQPLSPTDRADEANAAGWDPDQPLVAESNAQADGATSDSSSEGKCSVAHSAPHPTQGGGSNPAGIADALARAEQLIGRS